MTSTTVTVPVVGGSLSVPLVVADAPPAYPYPIVKWSTRTAGETLAHFLLKQPSPVIVDFENIPAQFSDFAQGAWPTGGWGLLCNYVVGLLNANLSMVPMSSTKAAVVNGLPIYTANSFDLIRLGGGPSGLRMPGFLTGEIDGTAQGHAYNGFQSYQNDHATFGPVKIKGVASSKPGGVPPYETGAVNNYHSTNETWSDFEIDGLDQTGTLVTDAGFLVSSQDKAGTMIWQRGYIHDVRGWGISHYNETNSTLNFIDMRFDRVGGALNFERCNGSTANIIRPTFGTDVIDIVADSDQGFIQINIIDPVLTPAHPKVIICVHAKYNYPPPDVSPNKQLDPPTNNHVTLTVGGVPRPDLVQFVSSYTPKP